MTSTLNQFLGSISPAKDVSETVGAGVYETRMGRMGCGRVLHRLDDETAICDGIFRKIADFIKYGPNLVLAVHRDRIVGFNHPGSLYILPTYRGRGLGPEMLAQLYLLDGPEVWFNRHRQLTAAGLIAHERAYKLLLERGLL